MLAKGCSEIELKSINCAEDAIFGKLQIFFETDEPKIDLVRKAGGLDHTFAEARRFRRRYLL